MRYFGNLTLILWLLTLAGSCGQSQNQPNTKIVFNDPIAVEVQGYSGHIMEPFLSRNGLILFFNNLNAPTENTNLHWASKIDQTHFQYQGELSGVNTSDLEGVPTMDTNQVFYFVYTGDYQQTLATIYQGDFMSGTIQNRTLVENISRRQMGWVNFDVEISDDGNTLYFVDGRFDAKGGPHEADLVIAQKEGAKFSRTSNYKEIFKNINTEALEYAAAISKDELEICFTRVSKPLNSNSSPKIFISSRNSHTEPFALAQQIEQLTGFVEAPTYAPDDQGIYYHQKVNGIFQLYFIQRK